MLLPVDGDVLTKLQQHGTVGRRVSHSLLHQRGTLSTHVHMSHQRDRQQCMRCQHSATNARSVAAADGSQHVKHHADVTHLRYVFHAMAHTFRASTRWWGGTSLKLNTFTIGLHMYTPAALYHMLLPLLTERRVWHTRRDPSNAMEAASHASPSRCEV
jgi:hypothetical protein